MHKASMPVQAMIGRKTAFWSLLMADWSPRITRCCCSCTGFCWDHVLNITCRWLSGIDRVEAERLLLLVGKSNPRQYSLRNMGWSFRPKIRRNYFTEMVVNLWNSVCQTVMEAPSSNIFKVGIDRFLVSRGIQGYGELVERMSCTPRSAITVLNVGTGSMYIVAYSCSYLLCSCVWSS